MTTLRVAFLQLCASSSKVECEPWRARVLPLRPTASRLRSRATPPTYARSHPPHLPPPSPHARRKRRTATTRLALSSSRRAVTAPPAAGSAGVPQRACAASGEGGPTTPRMAVQMPRVDTRALSTLLNGSAGATRPKEVRSDHPVCSYELRSAGTLALRRPGKLAVSEQQH